MYLYIFYKYIYHAIETPGAEKSRRMRHAYTAQHLAAFIFDMIKRI